MAADYDATEFVDDDFQAHKSPYSQSQLAATPHRAPSREEVDTRVAEAQQKLAELKRAQEELERERATLEETRRRQVEFQTGREEMLESLTRGIGLIEEAEFTARCDAEQMGKTLAAFREALAKVQAIKEEGWTKDNFGVELTRALTILENARMEWNGARLKYPVLANTKVKEPSAEPTPELGPLVAGHTFGELCRLGFALTWPLAIVLAAGLTGIAVILLRR
jgi:hypothetical protein